MKHFALLLGIVLLSCCTRSKPETVSLGPKETVEYFVKLSSEIKQVSDRAQLAGLCQGRMRRAFDSMSEDAFVLSYVTQPVEVKDLRILSTEVDENLARVHYRVFVRNPNGQDSTEEATEREVELLRVDGRWYLEAIRPKGSDQIAFTRGMIF